MMIECHLIADEGLSRLCMEGQEVIFDPSLVRLLQGVVVCYPVCFVVVMQDIIWVYLMLRERRKERRMKE